MKQARLNLVPIALVASLLLPALGCREEGSAHGPSQGGAGGSFASTAGEPGATLGSVAFRVLRRNTELGDAADNAAGKVAALDARKGEFITAVDTTIPFDQVNGLSSTLEDVIKLVDDGTLPALTSNVASILDLLGNDPQDPQKLTLSALAKLSTARSAVGKDQALKLAGRLLAYPELEAVLKAIATLVQENDGLDAAGRPTAAERDLLSDLIGTASRLLRDLERPASSAPAAPSKLVTTLLEPVEIRGGVQVGAPAWAVRTDANGNPKVRVDAATGRLYAPFVDANRDGTADVNAAGDPVDAGGAKIDITAFGDAGRRDADGRALSGGGQLLYEYFDVKRTTLGQVLMLAGQIWGKDVPLDLLRAVDATSTRVSRTDASGTYIAYSDDNPALDLAWAGLEIFRYRDAPKLLESMASLIRSDERRAERILVHLAKVIDILDRQQLQGGGNRKLIDDLVPLLDRVFESNGGGQAGADSLAKIVLDTFRTEITRVRRIPHGLAEMMKYSDYPSRTLTQPGMKSCLEQLMDMMAEANQCNVWPFGNMAEFYLDAMAGTKSILGLQISVYTINQLLDIPILRQLLCSQISPGNIRALHAFAQSGALDSLVPIARAFSTRGQTALLKNIFLALGANYEAALRPNEAVVVQVLDSGAVEELFDALNVMTTMRVPVTGEPVTDVVAQFIAALVDDDRPVFDRHGVRKTSLLHLLLDPLSAMGARIDASGVRAQYDRAVTNIITTVLATTIHDNGTPQNAADDYEALLNHGLIKLAAAGLESAADALSFDPTTRAREITDYQANVVKLFSGRDVPVLVDVTLAIERSPARRRLLDAAVNLLTPNLNVRNDIYGSILEVAAGALQARGDPQALVDVLRFAGRALDPARGWSKPIVLGLVKLVGGAQKPVVIAILKNALDRGPAGNARSPAETLFSILDDVQRQSRSYASAITAQSIADAARKAAEFIRDREKGLEHIYDLVRTRRR
jgi:hypothetical protein